MSKAACPARQKTLCEVACRGLSIEPNQIPTDGLISTGSFEKPKVKHSSSSNKHFQKSPVRIKEYSNSMPIIKEFSADSYFPPASHQAETTGIISRPKDFSVFISAPFNAHPHQCLPETAARLVIAAFFPSVSNAHIAPNNVYSHCYSMMRYPD